MEVIMSEAGPNWDLFSWTKPNMECLLQQNIIVPSVRSLSGMAVIMIATIAQCFGGVSIWSHHLLLLLNIIHPPI